MLVNFCIVRTLLLQYRFCYFKAIILTLFPSVRTGSMLRRPKAPDLMRARRVLGVQGLKALRRLVEEKI